jgi:NADH-quinone oxidoreductase subunit D
MLLVELNRIASHLLFQATNGLDLGAVSMIIYGWREREEVLRYLEYVTGLRMNNNFIRPGGVAAELPDGWHDRLLEVCDTVERGVREYE